MARPAQDEHPQDRVCSARQLRLAYQFALLEIQQEIREHELHVVETIRRRDRIKSLLAAMDATQPPENVK